MKVYYYISMTKVPPSIDKILTSALVTVCCNIDLGMSNQNGDKRQKYRNKARKVFAGFSYNNVYLSVSDSCNTIRKTYKK